MFSMGSYKKAFIYALLVHLVVAIVLSANISLDSRPTPIQIQGEQPDIVQAVAVDESQVQAEMDKIRAAEAKRERQQDAKQKHRDKQARDSKRKRQAEEQRLAKVKKQREEQAKKQKQEKQQLTELQAKKKLQSKRLAELEKQKRKQQAKLEKLQTEARQAEDKKRRLQEESARRKQLKEEQQRLAKEKAKRDSRQRAAAEKESLRYIALMQDKVKRNWLNPVANKKGLECVVRVRLNKSGKVLLVQVVHGSGNTAFDRSVEAAVLKSSPLPLPKDPTIMEGFPELRFKFKPQ